MSWSGAVSDHIDYSGYGVITTESNSSVGDQYKYASYHYIAATGMDIAGRVYNPATGDWDELDPDSFTAGQSNLYQYVANDPTNAIDPSGCRPYAGMPLTTRIQDEVFAKTEGVWPADWYFENVLRLDKSSAPLGDYVQNTVAGMFGKDPIINVTPEYDQFMQGCVGLCGLRLGFKVRNGISNAEGRFTSFDEALAFAKKLPKKAGFSARIFAVCFKASDLKIFFAKVLKAQRVDQEFQPGCQDHDAIRLLYALATQGSPEFLVLGINGSFV